MTEGLAAWRWSPQGPGGPAVTLTEVGASVPGPEGPWEARGEAVAVVPRGDPGAGGEHALRWEADAGGPGQPGLSLSEHGRYVARLRPGQTLEVGTALSAVRLGGDRDEALWLVQGRGRAGWTSCSVGLGRRTVAVRPRWLDGARAWRAMLDDLAAMGFADCLEGTGAAVPVGVFDGGAAVTAEAQWLGLQEALRPGRLDAALAAIGRHPRATVGRGVQVVPWQRASRARPEEVGAARAAGSRAAGVAESVPRRSLDSPEHRFARFALDDMARIARALRNAPGLDPAAVAAAGARLGALRAHDPTWASVRPAPSARWSLGLARHPGYRALWALWRLVRGASPVLAWDSPEATRAALRDTSALYERWCAVTLAAALGVSPPGRVSLLRHGATPCLGGTLWAQRVFAPGASWSLAWRPDLALERNGLWLLFDAKLRLDPSGEGPRDEVAKMHAYRDGIAGAWGALGLAPSLGPGAWWTAPDGGGVGMFGWRPGLCEEDAEAQRSTLRGQVAAFVAAASGTEPALWSGHGAS